MAKQVQKFQSDAGGLFDNECAALKDDLRHHINGVIKNDKCASDLADFIVENLNPVLTPAVINDGAGKAPEVVFVGWRQLIMQLSDACGVQPSLPLETVASTLTFATSHRDGRITPPPPHREIHRVD